jgi:hypothetical protein
MPSPQWLPPGERGAIVVKMALALPLLLLVVFAIVDFGLLFHAQNMITKAAREGARAEVFGQDPRASAGAAGEHLDGPVDASVTPCRNGEVRVVTTHVHSFVTPLAVLVPVLGGEPDGTVILTGTGVMPCS